MNIQRIFNYVRVSHFSSRKQRIVFVFDSEVMAPKSTDFEFA